MHYTQQEPKLMDLSKIEEQRKMLHVATSPLNYPPLMTAIEKGNPKLGLSLMKEGKVGALLIAGGVGSRLGFEGPKGAYKLKNGKSLFQLAAEKMAAACRVAGKDLPLAIMTSTYNDEETRRFFEENNYFGLNKKQVFFFVQNNLPLLLPNGELFYEEVNKIAEGPNGNGEALKLFYEKGIWTTWKKMGIEFVNVFLIDNPLALPIDPSLLGAHKELGVDILVKVTTRKSPDEKVGVMAQKGDTMAVIEYSELTDEAKQLDYRYANLSLFSVTMDFIQKAEGVPLPLHKAYKKAKILGREPEQPNAWKFETFIFDLFPHAKVKAMVFPREEIFSPLKNKVGDSSPDTVMRDIESREKSLYEGVHGKNSYHKSTPVSADYYYKNLFL